MLDAPATPIPGICRQVKPPSRTRPRRRPLLLLIALIVLLIAALVLPPLINISRYQRQIAASLAAGLGHPVEVSGITLHLLPRPGVQIANFVVDSTAGYSAEPILQCSSVTAAFRITSLWRGRLEIARISLDEPSLNLERASNGQWNFASVLLQASRTQQAPTGRAIARGQNRFPYIEASNARINFKHGAEKLPFSFLNADVSVWLENPDEWQLRFSAQPMRTDINLSIADTGQVQVSGSVHRASSANELPLNLQAEWRGAPLGQATRMLFAHDLGWRGDTRVTAHITGVPDALGLQLAAEATDFHRESFEPAHPLNLHATCTATYRHWQGSIDGIHCVSPVGNGGLSIRGAVRQIHAAAPEPDLKLIARHVPTDARARTAAPHQRPPQERHHCQRRIDGEFSYAQQPGADAVAGPDLRAALCSPPICSRAAATWSRSFPISASWSSPPASRWPSSSSRRTWTSAGPLRSSPARVSRGKAIPPLQRQRAVPSTCFLSPTHSISFPPAWRACRAAAPRTTT